MFGHDKRYENFHFYNFSGLKGQTQVSRKGLHFYSQKVTLVFSCVDKEFREYFLDNLFAQETIEVGSLKLTPEFIEEEKDVSLSEKVKFICISPILLAKPVLDNEKNKQFISPESDKFSDLVFESTLERMENFGNFSTEQLSSFSKFQIVPDKDYLKKMEMNNKKFARIYPVYDQDLKYEVRGYTFPFTLYAAEDVQRFIFDFGLGALGYKGFGMVDIANVDPSQRILQKKGRVTV